MVVLRRKGPFTDEEVMMQDVDTDEEESGSEESGEEAQAEPSKKAIYNREGLLEKLEDIAWPENVDWMHKLTIDHDQGEKIDVMDDLAREHALFTQALEGTRKAFEKLQSMKVRFLRPTDYYAEMVKTDAHMHRIKGRLLSEKKKMEESEERKKAREAKKRAKEVQAQKAKERAKQKKEQIESVKKWRKQRQQSGFAKGNDEGPELHFDGEEGFKHSKKKRPGVSPGDRSGGFAKRAASKKSTKRRESRETKFGHGGRKGLKKQNTYETTNDFRGFNQRDDASQNKKRKRFMIIPDMLKNAPMFKQLEARIRGKGRAIGVGHCGAVARSGCWSRRWWRASCEEMSVIRISMYCVIWPRKLLFPIPIQCLSSNASEPIHACVPALLVCLLTE